MSDTVRTPDELATSIKGIVQTVWDKSNQPVLLAALPPLIERDIGSFSEALGGTGLFRFTQTNLVDAVEVVRHPTQNSKVGLIPKGEVYEFPAESAAPQRNSVISDMLRQNRNRPTAPTKLDELMAILKGLDDEDLKSISIPVHVLVKLAK